MDAPAEAREAGFYNWRVTEGYWREVPASGPRGNLAFTVPPAEPRVAVGFFPAQPTEDYLGGNQQPHERAVLRWYILLKFPSGVSEPDGEAWFEDAHARGLRSLPGVYRAFSTRAIREPISLPGEWPPTARPRTANVLSQWDRLSELWFENFDDWRAFRKAASALRPSWATHCEYPFVRPRQELISSFLLERPTDEFWRDARGYL